jgi:hypothetical protein
MEYRTCTFIRDDGNICKSAAVTNRNLCLYHFDHRARLMRMAQYRARGERFNLQLPPLESMHAVQSALNQLSEALAADMIDLKRADRLMRLLNIASRNLLKSDKWPASPYHSDQPAPAVDLTAAYGLPADLDVNAPIDVAFPQSVILSEERSDESKDPFVSGHRAALEADLSPMPKVGYCSEHGYDCPDLVIGAEHPVTPEMVEIYEVAETKGADAAARRGNQLERNRQRRQLTADRKRYAAIALEKNMRVAAEKLAEQKLAERDAQLAAPEGCPVPPSVGGVAPVPDTAKKPVASTTSETIAPQEAESIA